ncbi:MAG: hypothetical protein JOZ57_13610 [Abitibacteriaceae bacterium]|nr:hypothetical protein [Abditibacteriaceae bacterium]
MVQDSTEAHHFIACCEPQFLALVEQATCKGGEVCIVLDGCEHEFTRDRLMACVWYALSQGVAVKVRVESAVNVDSVVN